MKTVLESMPQSQLLIVGEGKMKEELAGLTKSLEMERNVFFVERVVDTKDVLSAMDLFVMPSLKEGLGLALMEAMASGLAVIGSDTGGIRSLIQNNYNGLLVKPTDTVGLASTIVALLQNPEKREFLGKNARSFISQNFSQEKMVSQTEGVYLECVNAK
jgi:glycosyltransferase involved in cell wall biosynthesis